MSGAVFALLILLPICAGPALGASTLGASTLGAGAQDPAETQSRQPSGLYLADRLVAVVDDDPIFLSDLRRARILAGADQVGAAEADDRALLDELIERRLRLHEVDRQAERRVPRASVDAALGEVEQQLGGVAELDGLLLEAGLDRAELRQLLRRRLRVLAYVDERLGARIFIDEDAVEEYYEITLKQEMERRAVSLPPFDEVKADIQAVLYQEALNLEIETWTEELRARADIQNLWDQAFDPADLPPVTQTIQ